MNNHFRGFHLAKYPICPNLKSSFNRICSSIDGSAPLQYETKGSDTGVSTTAILNTIELAKQHEQKTQHLQALLEQQLDRVHMAIQLPQTDSIGSLLLFTIAYIEQVPSFLDAARAITRDAGIEAYAAPCLKLAEDFFLKPPEIVCGHIGLDELMDEAYLAHRLMEEVNDRFMARAGIPLIPMDTTLSNLVIHSLIGEPFSNELDEAVHYAVERVMSNDTIYNSAAFKDYVTTHSNDHWKHQLDEWPCLMDQLSINLKLAGLSI